MAPRIGVVGSVNLDLVAACRTLPRPGETVTGAVFSRHPGGKGANQALAARRLGASVTMVARVGGDPEADLALALLHEGRVDISQVRTDPELPTGVALIAVAGDGENQIVVAPGANLALTADDVDVAGCDAVVCQLEIPDAAIQEAARQSTGIFCLNAAPARAVPDVVLGAADVVVVNEIEHAALALEGLPGLMVVTSGAAGAAMYRGGREVARALPPPVEPVDTVGAGDAFVGALAVQLASGEPEHDALRFACAAGALATTRTGAQPSLPTRAEVEAILGS